MKIRGFVIFVLFLVFSVFTFNLVFAEDKSTPGGVIPKLPKTANDPELTEGRVYPNWGPPCQRYTYSVVYRDKEGREPQYVQIYFNGKMIDMDKENPNDNDYRKGVKYIYKYVPDKIDSNFYYFETSNGLGKARASIIDSPDNGPVLFTTAFDKNEIAVVEKNSGKKILSFPTGKEWIGGVALSDDGKLLAAKTSRHVYLFDTANPQKPLWQFNCEQCRVGEDVKGGVDISGDGSKIIAAFGEKVALFDKFSSKPVWMYSGGNSYNVAISKDGKYMAAATAGDEADINANLIILWSNKSEKPLWQYHASGNFHDVSFSDDGQFITGSTGCPDRRFYLFSKDSNNPLIRTEPLTRDSPVHRAKISSDGTLAAVGSEADDGAVLLFSKDSKKPVWKFSTPQRSSVRALNFTPSGQYIGAATFGGDAYIFDKAKNSPIASWKVNASLGGIDIADDGSFIATGGTDNKLYIFDKDSKSKTEIPFNEYIEEVDISGNGKYIAAGTGGSVYFFETYISQDRGRIFDCSKIIEPTPESQLLQAAGQDRRVKPTLTNQAGKFPGTLFGFGFIGSLILLGMFTGIRKLSFLEKSKLALSRLNQAKPISSLHLTVRKINIALSIFTAVFLFLTLVAIFANRQGPTTFQKEAPAINQDEKSSVKDKGGAICGNNLCEPSLGETKENCPKDCSAGN